MLNNLYKNYNSINNKKIWGLIQFITLVRILMGIMIFFKKQYMLIFFIIGLISDCLDGFLARKFKVTSKFGEILDPIADKIFIYLIFLSLFIKKFIVILIIKDIIVLTGGIYSRYYFNRAIITKIGKSTMIFMGLYLFLNIVKYHLKINNNNFIFKICLYFKYLLKYKFLIEFFLITVIILYIIQYIIIFYKSFIK